MALRASRAVRVTTESTSPLVLCPFQRQARPKWCWAACVAMALEGLDRPLSQCRIAGNHLQKACCDLPAQSCVGAGGTECDQTRQPADIDRLWTLNGVAATRLDRPLTREELEHEISGLRRPVMVYLEGQTTNFDHVMLVAGRLDHEWFIVADPCLDNFTVATHEELLKARGGWSRTWIDLK